LNFDLCHLPFDLLGREEEQVKIQKAKGKWQK